MPHTQCPRCDAPLRAPPGRRKLICPACRTKFRLTFSGGPPAPPRLPLEWRVELVSALIGVAALAALVACQVTVLLPLGRAYPGHREVRFPAVYVDDAVAAPETVQSRPYNQVLFWGSVVGYSVAAVASWYAIRRWKIALVRASRRHGLHGVGGGRTSAWRQWGGGTATVIVLLGGLAVAILGREILWKV